MAQVLDYSAGFPGAPAIKAAGYSGAVRYIGFPDRRKCTTAAELADFTAHGIGMALVYENVNTDWRGGVTAGRNAGNQARHHADAIGFPRGRPIYAAIDQDVVATGEFSTMLDYMRGFAEYQGGAKFTGVYGEADVIDRALLAGVAEYFWQTVAWSRGRRTAANLFQHVGLVTVGGVGCDVNDVLASDWGQHNLEGTMADFKEILTDWDTGDQAAAYVWLIAARKDAELARKVAEENRATLAEIKAQLGGAGVTLVPSGSITVRAEAAQA